MLIFTVRSSRLRPLAAVAGLAVFLVLYEERKGGPNVGLFVTLATVVVAAGAAYAVEDDAAVTVAPSPVTLLRRRALRVGVAAGIATVGWLVAAGVAVAGSDASPLTAHNAALAAATGGIGLAMAAACDRRGLDQAGLGGTVAAVVTVLTLTTAAMKHTWLPSLVRAADDEKWLVIGALGWLVALWMTRDPASRGRRTGRGLLLST